MSGMQRAGDAVSVVALDDRPFNLSSQTKHSKVDRLRARPVAARQEMKGVTGQANPSSAPEPAALSHRCENGLHRNAPAGHALYRIELFCLLGRCTCEPSTGPRHGA